MRCKWLSVTLTLLTLASIDRPAWADDVEDLEETDILPAVQNRKYRTDHELSLGIGILPIDPFFKGMLLIGGYAWHITDLWAVEGRYYYSKNFKTSLREQTEENYNVPTARFDEINWYTHGGVLFKPLYGKLSLFNKTLVYGEFYLSAHAALAQLDGGRRTDTAPAGKGKRFAIGGAPGFGIRGYLHEYISVRFDFRSMILYAWEDSETHYPISLALTIAFTTRSDL